MKLKFNFPNFYSRKLTTPYQKREAGVMEFDGDNNHVCQEKFFAQSIEYAESDVRSLGHFAELDSMSKRSELEELKASLKEEI